MRVLVGVEDTEGARAALRWAAGFAAAAGGSLVVVEAWQYPSVPIFADERDYAGVEQMDERAVESAREIVASVLGDAAPDIEYRALRGPAATAIRQAAEELRADLIVVGARSARPMDRRLLGSVSRSVAEDAPCPVAVVPADLSDTDGPVVVGVDGSEDARRALEWAAVAAQRSSSEVVLVHGFGPYGAELPPEALADDKEHCEHLVAEYHGTLEAQGVAHRSVVRVHDARSLLEKVGEEEHARMVVVGARGTGKLAAMLLGSVASYLVLNLKRPTVIVHR
jgi:nucleotide-binding universal stress UspA family protein